MICFEDKPQMVFPISNFNQLSRFWLRYLVVACFLVTILPYGAKHINDSKVTNIGAIIDYNSRTGKEMRTAMGIAVRKFNNGSPNHKLSLKFQDSRRSPLQAARAGIFFLSHFMMYSSVLLTFSHDRSDCTNVAS